MKHSRCRRGLSLLLALILCFTLISPLSAAAAGDAMSTADLKELVNSQTLYPQRTGYAALDAILEEIFAPYEDADNYTKLKAAYDWTVRNIDYSWEGYTQQVYSGFSIDYPYDDYEEGLQEAIPFEVVSRSYHTLTAHKGVCYDWGALLAVMLRYLGFEAYVHTGYFIFEAGYGTGSGMHGWTEVVLDGEYYIFDPQRDYRMSANGTSTIPYNYFGISMANAWRYTEDTAANAARDAGFLSVTAERQQNVTVYAGASRSGTVTGAGVYATGTTATLTAVSTTGAAFLGWYTTDGTLLSTASTLTFTVTGTTAVAALFAGDIFYDIDAGSWYLDDVLAAVEAGIVVPGSSIRFDGSEKLTRGEAILLLARAAGENPADTAAAVAWAMETGITTAETVEDFAAEQLVTRQEFTVLLARLLEYMGADLSGTALPFTDADAIADWAADSVATCSALGLVTGYDDGSFRPAENISRAQGVSLIMRLLELAQTPMLIAA